MQKIGHLPIKTHPCSILQVPTAQLAKMRIDLKFVELTADVLEFFFYKIFCLWFSKSLSPLIHLRNPRDFKTSTSRTGALSWYSMLMSWCSYAYLYARNATCIF